MAFRSNSPDKSILSPSASGPAYRPDVDGLRAIAILAVLLFHAEVGLPGGFAGVDVFFVISGYLITRLLVQDYDRGSASLATFWMRRLRRIAPAMTVMTLVVLVAGYVLLLPEDLMDLGRSVLANQALAANVYFWRSTGYFDGPRISNRCFICGPWQSRNSFISYIRWSFRSAGAEGGVGCWASSQSVLRLRLS